MTKLGRILGIVGFVSLLSIPIPTMFLWDWQFTWVAAAKLVFGVFCLAFWLSTNLRNVRDRFRGRSVFYWSFAALFVVIGLAVVVVVNYIFQVYPHQIDLTSEKIFSLSDQSKQLLESLKDDVKVVAFYNSKEREYPELRDVFEMYRYGSSHFAYEFVDPLVHQELVEQYKITAGGPRVVVSHGKKEERVKFGEEEQSGLEEAITTALLKVTALGEKQKVCFTTGHGEKGLKGDDPQQVVSLLSQDLESEGYSADSLSLLEQPEVPAACKAVVLAGPRQDLLPGEIGALKKYLDSGGKLLAFLGVGDTASLNAMLLSYQVQVGGDTVVNPKSRAPLEVVTDPMRYPQAHPIFAKFFRGGMVFLNQLQAIFPLAHSVRKAGGEQKDLEVTELALSSPQAWGEIDKLEAGATVAYDEGKDFPGPVPLAVVVEKKAPGAPGAEAPASGMRLAVFGSSWVVADAAYRVFPFNRDLTMNTLAWLVQEEKKVTIRPRFRAAALLQLDESQMKFITFFSTDILPLVILALGITIWQVRRWS